MLTLLGPTATGKTALAARLAAGMNGEIISADSRQVYRGMTIGTGKDYGDYLVDGEAVPYHLVDIAEPGTEYNIFKYRQDFSRVYTDLLGRGKLPILCGGSGMYLEAVLRGYTLPELPDDDGFETSLEEKSFEELVEILESYKPLHNKTDLEDRPRLVKAILVAHAAQAQQPNQPARASVEVSGIVRFPVQSVIFGIDYPRGLVRNRITRRLMERLENGMVQEVQQLLDSGITPERLIRYGLEYRFLTLYLTGQLSYNAMFSALNTAIHQFAKRQMTWFRRMERMGLKIHWIDGRLPMEEKIAEIQSKI